MGIEDSPDFYYTQTFEGGDSAGDPALVRILADNALDAVHWMEDHGLIYEKEVFTAIAGLWQRGTRSRSSARASRAAATTSPA